MYIYNHPDYCTVLGHADARSKVCCANDLTTAESNFVWKKIFEDAVQKKVLTVGNVGTFPKYFSQFQKGQKEWVTQKKM